MAIFLMPAILKPQRCDPNLRNFAASGPPTGTGRQQRVFSDAGYWAVDYEILLDSAEKVRAWRVMVARLRAGDEVYAWIYERSQVPGALSIAAEAELGDDVALRDTEITISATGVQIKEGMYFGIGDRLHMVTEVVSGGTADLFNQVTEGGPWQDDGVWSDDEPAAVDFVVKVIPPMRSAYAAEVPVKLKDIVLLGALDDLSMGDTSLDLIKRGSVSFTIRESI